MKYLSKFNEELGEDAFIQGEEGMPEDTIELGKLEKFCCLVDEELEKNEYDDATWDELIDMFEEQVQKHNIKIEDLGTIVEQEWYYECGDIIYEYYHKKKKELTDGDNREQQLDNLLEDYVKKHIEHIYDNPIEKDGEILFDGNKVIYSIIIEKGN